MTVNRETVVISTAQTSALNDRVHEDRPIIPRSFGSVLPNEPSHLTVFVVKRLSILLRLVTFRWWGGVRGCIYLLSNRKSVSQWDLDFLLLLITCLEVLVDQACLVRIPLSVVEVECRVGVANLFSRREGAFYWLGLFESSLFTKDLKLIPRRRFWR